MGQKWIVLDHGNSIGKQAHIITFKIGSFLEWKSTFVSSSLFLLGNGKLITLWGPFLLSKLAAVTFYMVILWLIDFLDPHLHGCDSIQGNIASFYFWGNSNLILHLGVKCTVITAYIVENLKSQADIPLFEWTFLWQYFKFTFIHFKRNKGIGGYSFKSCMEKNQNVLIVSEEVFMFMLSCRMSSIWNILLPLPQILDSLSGINRLAITM